LGYDEETFIGQHFSCIFEPEDIAKGEPARELRTAAIEGQADNERWHLRNDGTRFWAAGTVTPLQDGAKRLHGFAVVMRDNTERRMTEARHHEAPRCPPVCRTAFFIDI
jgi:PAS domain S-box-containing protein